MAIPVQFLPKSILCLRNYKRSDFFSDVIAGVTVGCVALPLAMAFAISSGVPPQAGIYTAIVAGFLISALGGSKTQIGGPTGAFVVVVSAIVAKHGLAGLYHCTFMAGIFLVLLGITGLGAAVKYIPRPVIIGFTNGIAVLIASTQLKDLLGLKIDSMPGEFIGRIDAVYQNLGSFSAAAAAVSAMTLAIIVLTNRMTPKIPGTLAALVIASTVAVIFRLPVENVTSRFGEIPRTLPDIVRPEFSPGLMLSLLSPTITIAILGAIESLLSAVVSDRMSNDRHNPNVELVAQGIANICTPLVGGLPATGAIARTATNIRSGARSPVSGMIHAVTLLLILVAAAPVAGRIPLPVLSGLLLVVAYNMGEWREIPGVIRLGYSSTVVWLITFGLTVFADLTVAVEAGMALAALLFIRKVTNTTTIAEVTPEHIQADAEHNLHLNPFPSGAAMFRIHGPFLFGAVEKLSIIYDKIDSLPPVVLIRLRNMNAIDATGVLALEELAETLKKSGRSMIICGMRDQPERIIGLSDIHEVIGRENVCKSLRAGVERATEILKVARQAG